MSTTGPLARWGATFATLALLAACDGEGGPLKPRGPQDPGGGGGDATYDLDALGVPRFVTTNYIGLEGLSRISYFRSHDGHDYSDSVERCRSMKHYFKFPGDTTPVYAPVAGTVHSSFQEWAGTQIQIRSDEQPAFLFVIFHVAPAVSVTPGTRYGAGQLLGWHATSQTYSDIAVEVSTPAGRRLVSYFDTLADAAFAPFQARGAASRAAFTITRAQRDGAPLGCSGEGFTAEAMAADPYPVDTTF